MDKIFDFMTKEDLTPDLGMLESVLGMDIIKKLLKEFSGMSFYIPKITRLDSLIMKYIEKNKGKTTKELAKELNVSTPYLKSFEFRKAFGK